jgi:hypothetical protein
LQFDHRRATERFSRELPMGIENEFDSFINRMVSLRDRVSGRDFVGAVRHHSLFICRF